MSKYFFTFFFFEIERDLFSFLFILQITKTVKSESKCLECHLGLPCGWQGLRDLKHYQQLSFLNVCISILGSRIARN